MTKTDIIKRAQALIKANPESLSSAGKESSLSRASKILDGRKKGLDVYIAFDTTGSMYHCVDIVRNDLGAVTDTLLGEGSLMRLSMNGIGDHCDGANWIQMYELSGNAEEVQGAVDSIVMTGGGDEPEAYECLALELAKRLPEESAGRRRAVVLVADSVPHGMIDEECNRAGDYQKAFQAMKTLCDAFYLVGCNEQMYGLQRKLIDSSRPDKERLIPLGDMRDMLPELLAALAKKTESEKSFTEYLKQLERDKPDGARKVYGLLCSGK